MYIKRLDKNFSILDKDMLIAHKGIYGYSNKLKKYIKPNSFEACKIAIDNGISFECDIRNTKDNVAVLSHDNYIEFKGQRIKISKYMYQDLYDMMQEETPARLEDVLKYNNGKVGVVVDAKEVHIFYSKYRDNLAIALNYYAKKGEIMLQSFNPLFMLSMRKHLKGVLTGQLICRGKTLLDSFKTPKRVAYMYEKIISLICFIARTDVINMENHSDEKWHKRTKLFISEFENQKVLTRNEVLMQKLQEGERILNSIADKIQLVLVKMAHELTKKPVLAFTIQDESEFDIMENLYIVNYIADFSCYGLEEYIKKVKEVSRKNNQ